jgi:hypothetical protein
MLNYILSHEYGWEVQLHAFLTSATGGVIGFAHLRFTLRETEPGTHFIGGWVDPWDGVDVLEKRKMSCLYRQSNPDSSVVQPVT